MSGLFRGVDVAGLDALDAWLGRIGERPAVQKAPAIPERLVLAETDANRRVEVARKMLA